MALWPARYGAEHPVDVRFAPTEAERRHKSGVQASRYATIGQDCGSTKYGTIRKASFDTHIISYCSTEKKPLDKEFLPIQRLSFRIYTCWN